MKVLRIHASAKFIDISKLPSHRAHTSPYTRQPRMKLSISHSLANAMCLGFFLINLKVRKKKKVPQFYFLCFIISELELLWFWEPFKWVRFSDCKWWKPSSHGLSKKMFVFCGLTILEVDVAFPMSLNPKRPQGLWFLSLCFPLLSAHWLPCFPSFSVPLPFCPGPLL